MLSAALPVSLLFENVTWSENGRSPLLFKLLGLGLEQMKQADAHPVLSAHKVQPTQSSTGERHLALTLNNIFFIILEI